MSGAQTDAGDYNAAASAVSNPNYKLPAEATTAFKITRNDDTDKTTITDAQKAKPQELTYNGGDQALVTAPESLPDGYSIRYSVDDGVTWTETVPTGKNAGSYTVKVKYLGNANLADFFGDDIPVTISEKPVTVTAADQTVDVKTEINGALDQAALAGALDGHVLAAVTLTGSSTEEPTISGTITPGEALIKDAGGLDVTANYEITYVAGKLTVKGDKSLSATVEPDDDVPVTKVEGITEELAKKLLTEEETTMYDVGVPVHVYLELHLLDEKDVPAGDKTAAGAEIERLGAQLGAYLDLSLFKRIGSQVPEKIHDTKGSMITVVVEIPTALRNTNTSLVRTFYIIRIHDGKAEILAQGTGTSLTIQSDKFSTYLIAYKDTVRAGYSGGTVPHTPQTGGTRHIGLWLCVLAVAGLGFGATTLCGKKRRTNK